MAETASDTLTVRKKLHRTSPSVDNNGNVIFKSPGDGGSTITVSNVEHITVIGDGGESMYEKSNQPPPVPTPPPDDQFDYVKIVIGGVGDVDQIEFGTPGKDKIVQYGGTGNYDPVCRRKRE